MYLFHYYTPKRPLRFDASTLVKYLITTISLTQAVIVTCNKYVVINISVNTNHNQDFEVHRIAIFGCCVYI